VGAREVIEREDEEGIGAGGEGHGVPEQDECGADLVLRCTAPPPLLCWATCETELGKRTGEACLLCLRSFATMPGPVLCGKLGGGRPPKEGEGSIAKRTRREIQKF
jgi:hypothetical protein